MVRPNKNKVIFWDESEKPAITLPYSYRRLPVRAAMGYMVDDHNGNGYFNSQEEIDESGLTYEIGTPCPAT